MALASNRKLKKARLPLPWLAVLMLLSACSSSRLPPEFKSPSRYDHDTKTLSIHDGNSVILQFAFNRCGAINAIYDQVNTPTNNLVAPSYAGETTDRVIQWTYWNSAYLGEVHTNGDGDRRLNVTMEGAFGDEEFCRPIAEYFDAETNSLRFESEVDTWFYANLNHHGRVKLSTTLDYRYKNVGILHIKRTVTREPAILHNVLVHDANGDTTYWTDLSYSFESGPVSMTSQNLGENSFTSYLETWVPFNGEFLPDAQAANGYIFKPSENPDDWYQNWDPSELGGWTMAYRDDKQAIALVYGQQQDDPEQNLFVTFNRIHQAIATGALNILLHGVETNCPDHHSLTPNYALVIGKNPRVSQVDNEVKLNINVTNI